MIHRYHSRLRRWLQCLSSQPPGTRNNYLPRVGLFTFVILVGKETAEPFHGVLSQILFVFLRCLGRPEAEPPASTSGNWGDDGQKLVAQARRLLQKNNWTEGAGLSCCGAQRGSRRIATCSTRASASQRSQPACSKTTMNQQAQPGSAAAAPLMPPPRQEMEYLCAGET